MSSPDAQIEKLEQAILQRARKLADSHLASAEQQRQKIMADAHKKLRQYELQATHEAKAAAEQEFHRLVQASEINMQAEFDKLRWSLLQEVLQKLNENLQQLSQKKEQYLPILTRYLQHAANNIPAEDLAVQVNQADYKLLTEQWDSFVQACNLRQNCQLLTTTINCSGGLLVYSSDKRIQVDNTFEGIIERYADEIYQEIHTQLFATAY
jgi:V/A-type H+/Na+-transporting ATPase subunit E